MVKDMMKRRSLAYGFFGLLLASFLILLRKTVFVNSLIPWYLILMFAWTIEGVLFGVIVHRLNILLQKDELTNLYNYKSLQKQLNLELLQAKRKKQDLSMLMIDVDYFKIINDLHGHLVGDE